MEVSSANSKPSCKTCPTPRATCKTSTLRSRQFRQSGWAGVPAARKVNMDALGKFTQYYVVSMILPGLFNATTIVFSLNRLNILHQKIQPTTTDWLFIVFFSTLITLFLGMLLESKIFLLIRDRKTTTGTITSYTQLASWRENLFTQIDESQNLKSSQLIYYTEQLMAEYYFLNNILLGVIATSLLFLIFLPYTNLLNAILYRIAVVIATTIIFIAVRTIMRTWLKELFKLQSTKVSKAHALKN
jgi:hypothetical protein